MKPASTNPAEPAPAQRVSGPRRLGGGLAGAVAFLTVVPVPRSWTDPGIADLADSIGWLPLIGAGLGAAAGALRLVTLSLLGSGPSTVLAMAALVLASGALHQDALADFADGLSVRGDRDHRLAAMRDPRLGAFGVLALIAWALLLFTAVEPLSGDHALLALIVAGATGRLAALIHAAGAPPARPDGLGASLHVRSYGFVQATVISLAAALGFLGLWRGALALGVAIVAGALTAAGARRAVGGRTGDTLGAAVALTEVTVCLALLASWR